MPGGELHPARLGGLGYFTRFIGIERDRLFHQHMQPCIDAFHRQRMVELRRCQDMHRIDRAGRKHLVEIGKGLHPVGVGKPLRGAGRWIADGAELYAPGGAQGVGMQLAIYPAPTRPTRVSAMPKSLTCIR